MSVITKMWLSITLGRVMVPVSFLVLVFISLRLIAALYFWAHQEQKENRYYADGRIFAWRGLWEIMPNGEKKLKYVPVTLFLRFHVSRGNLVGYGAKAPSGVLSNSKWFRPGKWGLYQQIEPGKDQNHYLLQVETRAWVILGTWALRNAVWLENNGKPVSPPGGVNPKVGSSSRSGSK